MKKNLKNEIFVLFHDVISFDGIEKQFLTMFDLILYINKKNHLYCSMNYDNEKRVSCKEKLVRNKNVKTNVYIESN